MTLKLACVVIACVAIQAGCGQKREPTRPSIDPGTADRLGLTEDARDPTQRDLDAGYYKWKAKPEPEGTLDPTSPGRRRVGGSNP